MSAVNLFDFRHLARKIVCVGRNYRDHALELKNPLPKKPMLFVKTSNAFISDGGKIRIPSGCREMHQEVELGVVIGEFSFLIGLHCSSGKTASRVSKAQAMDYVGGYTVALDMTARDLQNELKAEGHPWFLAKSFDTSCPVAAFVPKEKVDNPHQLELLCKVNGEVRQKDRTDKMIFDIPTLIEFTTRNVTLEVGDLLLTGTPAGVGPCKSGDRIDISLSDLAKATFSVE
ncbi:FAA-hydrolase domain-containing protein [Aphelenchoides besseyi]|nr:FAA-hydrolase domain-containing protein [Aphelenchoides besseyi]KAI6198527.1 FAA-hydrolase domain-containing protein [Aphelenchoides besseyi]